MATTAKKLLDGLRQRREDERATARADYHALVRRLAGGALGPKDTPAAVASLLERAGHDERQLGRDVARIEAHRVLVEAARPQVELEAQAEAARSVAQAAHEREQAERARLRAETNAAREKSVAAEQAAEKARDAFDQVIGSAPFAVRERFEDARLALSGARGAQAKAREPQAEYNRPPEPLSERVAAEWQAIAAAGAALQKLLDRQEREQAGVAEDINLSDGVPAAELETLVERKKAEKAVEDAREAYRLALLAAADAVEADLPALREGVDAARQAVLAAELPLDVEEAAQVEEESGDDFDDQDEGDGEDLDPDDDE